MSDPSLLAHFSVTDPQPIAKTGIAAVWQVCRADGSKAALKLYHKPTMGNEAPGLAYMQAKAGPGMAQIYGQTENALLLEWLPGPSLGDQLRAGDESADASLGNLAQTLRARPSTTPRDLPTLDSWFAALFTLNIAPGHPARPLFTKAQEIARYMLASAPAPQPLHGDLHHDNVRKGETGWTAFDAKGLLADPAYELANAFRNPKGRGPQNRAAQTITARADLWCHAMDVPKDRLLNWAAAKSALSITWQCGGELCEDHPELPLLAALLTAATSAP